MKQEKDIKEILAENLVALRKAHHLTQNELAEKLNYSDNTISRWEHAEITPGIESLAQIAKVYDIPIETLLKENATEQIQKQVKVKFANGISSNLLFVCLIWLVAAVSYIYIQSYRHQNRWVIFVWAVPLSSLVMIFYSLRYRFKLLVFLFTSGAIWSGLAAIYLSLLPYNVYLVFIIGLPAQAAIAVWTFLRGPGSQARRPRRSAAPPKSDSPSLPTDDSTTE